MSGIAGILYNNRRLVEEDYLKHMLDVLAHRGPDGAKLWNKESVGFGHRMLHTTPESLHEVLPLVKQTARLAITADARIDNRKELLPQLGFSSDPSREVADSQLILAAYEKWGENCTKRLLGDFAFAIWDGAHCKLFCARDPIGIKPFYYYWSGSVFVFASEIKAILCLKEVPRKLNEVKLADFLVPVFKDQTSTYYQGIFRLPPAHSMTVLEGKLRTWAYWSLDPTRELRLSSNEEYEETFRELFMEAVRCRLRSAFPVGSNLSGGLDSSSVACTAGKLLAEDGRDRLHTFSAIFPSVVKEDPRIDEHYYINSVLTMDIFEPHFVRADRCKPLEDVAWHKDEPWPAPSLYMGRAIFKTASQHNVRVLLSGFDGDVTVSYGYEYLDQLARSARWADFSREAHALARRRPGTEAMNYLRNYGMPCLTELAGKWRWFAFIKQMREVSEYFGLSYQYLLVHAGLKPFLPDRMRWLWQRLRGRTPSAAPLKGLNNAINPDFAQRMDLARRIQTFELPNPSSADPLREQHVHSLSDGRLEYVANIFDQTAAPFSVESRYPFFDRRLLEFCLALPFEQKLRNGWTRSIFRRSMENILPPEVQWRISKGNLSTNVRRRLLEERELLDAVILQDPEIIEEYVDVKALQADYRRFLSEPGSASEEDFFTIFLSANLALWLKQTGFSPTG